MVWVKSIVENRKGYRSMLEPAITGGFVSCPTWANNINDPVRQHLVLVTVLAGNTLEVKTKKKKNPTPSKRHPSLKDGLNNLTGRRLAKEKDVINGRHKGATSP